MGSFPRDGSSPFGRIQERAEAHPTAQSEWDGRALLARHALLPLAGQVTHLFGATRSAARRPASAASRLARSRDRCSRALVSGHPGSDTSGSRASARGSQGTGARIRSDGPPRRAAVVEHVGSVAEQRHGNAPARAPPPVARRGRRGRVARRCRRIRAQSWEDRRTPRADSGARTLSDEPRNERLVAGRVVRRLSVRGLAGPLPGRCARGSSGAGPDSAEQQTRTTDRPCTGGCCVVGRGRAPACVDLPDSRGVRHRASSRACRRA